MTDLALVTAQYFAQFVMTTRGPSLGTALCNHSPPEDVFLPSRDPPYCHRFLPPTPLQ
jgi:hypothetical protein